MHLEQLTVSLLSIDLMFLTFLCYCILFETCFCCWNSCFNLNVFLVEFLLRTLVFVLVLCLVIFFSCTWCFWLFCIFLQLRICYWVVAVSCYFTIIAFSCGMVFVSVFVLLVLLLSMSIVALRMFSVFDLRCCSLYMFSHHLSLHLLLGMSCISCSLSCYVSYYCCYFCLLFFLFLLLFLWFLFVLSFGPDWFTHRETMNQHICVSLLSHECLWFAVICFSLLFIAWRFLRFPVYCSCWLSSSWSCVCSCSLSCFFRYFLCLFKLLVCFYVQFLNLCTLYTFLCLFVFLSSRFVSVRFFSVRVLSVFLVSVRVFSAYVICAAALWCVFIWFSGRFVPWRCFPVPVMFLAMCLTVLVLSFVIFCHCSCSWACWLRGLSFFYCFLCRVFPFSFFFTCFRLFSFLSVSVSFVSCRFLFSLFCSFIPVSCLCASFLCWVLLLFVFFYGVASFRLVFRVLYLFLFFVLDYSCLCSCVFVSACLFSFLFVSLRFGVFRFFCFLFVLFRFFSFGVCWCLSVSFLFCSFILQFACCFWHHELFAAHAWPLSLPYRVSDVRPSSRFCSEIRSTCCMFLLFFLTSHKSRNQAEHYFSSRKRKPRINVL